MKIVVDAFGGDYSPSEIVKGAVDSLSMEKDFSVILTGDQEKIEAELSKYKFDRSRVEIVHATEIITNDDVPTEAIRFKKNSSLVVAFNLLRENPEVGGLVCAGSTGAVLTGGIKVGRIKGISRPALAPILPTANGGHVLMLDIGANVDCKSINLVHFAVMGTAYMKMVFGIERPRVALLSNGVEDKKGNALTKETFPLLKELKEINFVGNMEARDLLSGEYDVVVTDGFAGNVALKASEGAIGLVLGEIKKSVKASFLAKIGALLMKKSFVSLKKKLDYNQSGGAPMLGIEKVIVKSHGSSKALAIANSVLQAKHLAESGFIDDIKKTIASMEVLNVEKND